MLRCRTLPFTLSARGCLRKYKGSDTEKRDETKRLSEKLEQSVSYLQAYRYLPLPEHVKSSGQSGEQ